MLYIRADMNDTIATGHIMRCLSIADAVRNLGEEVLFIVADGQALPLLESRGYKSVVLDTAWNDMDSEIVKLQSVIQRYGKHKLLIDSYMVTDQYLQQARALTYTIYIDDLNAFYYPADAIISYANYADEFHYEELYPQAELMVGPKYVPLRQEFSGCLPKVIKAQAECLLIVCGGTDNYHIIWDILDGIDLAPYKQINVICGRYSKDYSWIKEKYKDNSSVCIWKSVDNIKEFYDKADIAVSAAGSTLYELCAVGTPAVSYTLADNQFSNARRFCEDGIIDYAGDVRFDNYVERISELLDRCRTDKEYRQKRSDAMQVLVDGRGAERIAESFID